MMNKGIEGFTRLQKSLADRIWTMDTQAELEQFVSGLPKNLKREAYVVMQMIIAQELDKEMEVTDEVSAYCRSL
jgi:hypothetical protein